MLLIYLGKYLFKNHESTFRSGYIAVVSLIILVMYTFTIGKDPSSLLIGMIVNKYPDVVTLTIGTLAGLYLISYIGVKISSTWIGNILSLCGRESFYIMALHMLFYRIIIYFFNEYLDVYVDAEGSLFPNLISFIVLFVGSIGLTLLSVKVTRVISRYVFNKK